MAKSVAKAVFVIACLSGGAAIAEPEIDINLGVGPAIQRTDGPDVRYALPTHNGSWLDFGLLYGRLEPSPGTAYSTEMVRFGPRVSINHWLYVGGEADIGRISGTASVGGTNYARTDNTTGGAMSGPEQSVDMGGTIAMAKAVVGARLLAGPFSGSAELAAGVRDYMLQDGMNQYEQGYFGAVYEAHGRLDFWLRPTLSIGAVANVDLADKNDVSAGLMVGFHFAPYDGLKR
jgi:hypothetical protein